VTDEATRAFSVATWNMDHWRRTPADRARAWSRLQDDIRPTVALLQECAPIRGLAAPHIYRELGRSRRWGTAVIALGAGAELQQINHAVTPYSPQSLPVHGSVPGALAVARVTLPDVAPITVVSVYGLIDVYSQTSMLRHVADLIPLFDSVDGVILGGDFNVGTDTRGPHRDRYAAIHHAVRSLGLVDLYATVADRPLGPDDCPCIDDPCAHLTTRDSGGAFDYLFASPAIAEHCQRIVCHDDPETRTLSDHFPVVAEFELPVGSVRRRWDVASFVEEVDRRAGAPAAAAVEQLVHWTARTYEAQRGQQSRFDRVGIRESTDPVWRQSINGGAVCWTVFADGTLSLAAGPIASADPEIMAARAIDLGARRERAEWVMSLGAIDQARLLDLLGWLVSSTVEPGGHAAGPDRVSDLNAPHFAAQTSTWRGKMGDQQVVEVEQTMPTAGFTALFEQQASGSHRPLENFTSTMLALAINANPSPFLVALQAALDRGKVQGRDASDAGTLLVRIAPATKACAETQVFLEAHGGDAQRGYLDVVVTLDDGSQSQEVWIEAKVDAGLTMHQVTTPDPETAFTDPDAEVSEAEASVAEAEAAVATAKSIHQVQVYLAHRPLGRVGRPSEPLIVTLARNDQVVPDVAGITWQDIYDAAETAASGDFVWTEVRRFLREQGMAFERMELTAAAILPVFTAVNTLMKELWPRDRANSNMHTNGVSTYVNPTIEAGFAPMLTAQCLSYGARPAGDGVEWWIAVGDGSDFQKTHVPVERVIEAAPTWFRESWSFVDEKRVDRIDVFEKRLTTASTQEAIDFLTAALREIFDAGVIEPYLAKRRARS
jgi:endonuclease/exonuclease/phosphatase family metal-dependent hydrolase